MTPFQEIRAQIPAALRRIYMDSAATSPLPRYVRDAVAESMERRAWYGEGFFDEACARVDAIRQDVADHLAVRPEGIAFMKNTGEGINHIARSLRFKAGDNVVVTGLEFPTNRFPWQALERQGVELRTVEPDDAGLGVTPDALAAAVDDRTALVAVSWVTFQTGYRHDVAAFGKVAHEHDALFLVDGIQGLGAVAPPEMRHVDFFACGGHKWLMAPFGVGFLYVRPELVPDIEPDHLGWWSLADWGDYDAKHPRLAATARRFEIGNLGFDVIEGLGAAIRHLPEMSSVETQVRRLTTALMERLAPLGRIGTPEDPMKRAGIVRFGCEDAEAAHQGLLDAGVQASLRSGALRFSPHFWNTMEEVERVGDVVEGVLTGKVPTRGADPGAPSAAAAEGRT